MPNNPLKKYHHGSKPYALVTGSTGGMGEEWAKQLADLGFNLILHGRSSDKLSTLKQSILSKSNSSSSTPIEIKTFISDASQSPPRLDGLSELLKQGQGLNLTIVINNIGVVGKGYPCLEECREEEILSMIAGNAIFATLVANKTLASLKKSQPSLMVNVTSLGAWAPSPYLSVYSATKSYNLGLSHSLYNEQRAEGNQVDVVAIAPGQVVSGMNEGPPTKMMPLASEYIKCCISSLAPSFFSSRPPPVLIPWPMHSFGAKAMNWMPQSMKDKTIRDMIIGLKKKEKAENKRKPETEEVTLNGDHQMKESGSSKVSQEALIEGQSHSVST